MSSATNRVPEWDVNGVVPAIDEDAPTSRARSPYTVSPRELIKRFGHTAERRNLLAGLLDYRAKLHQAGLSRGFQWINGSFVENVERTEMRPPKDMDIVTFHHVPEGFTEETFYRRHRNLFDATAIARDYAVHAYYVCIDSANTEFIIENCTYWYSLWSHNRNRVWKGYLQLDLSESDDFVARKMLNGDPSHGDES